MPKTTLKQMIEQLTRQNSELTDMVLEIQQQLLAHSEQLDELNKNKEQNDDDFFNMLLGSDSPEEKHDEPAPEPAPNPVESEHEKACRKLKEMLESMLDDTVYEDAPTLTARIKEQDCENLKPFSEGMLLHLLRLHVGDRIAEAYIRKRLSPDLYGFIIRYFDDLVNERALTVTVADEAAAEHEEVRLRCTRETQARTKLAEIRDTFTLQGREELETFFNEQVVHVIAHLAEYQAMGINFPSPFILEGPPGCGKTYAVEKLAKHLGWKTFRITEGSVGCTYVHGTAVKISEMFDEAEKNAPSLVIIDEMDALMPLRTEAESTNHHVAEVDCFLQLLQTAAEKKILVVGMTNYINRIDPAVLRTGRMGTHLKVGMPSLTEVKAVLRYAIGKRPHAEDLDIDSLAEQLPERPLSDVAYVADEAAMVAVRAGHKRIEQEDLNAALARLLARQDVTETRRPLGFCA